MNSAKTVYRRIKIVRHIGPMERGGSKPQLMTGEDGSNYVLKFKENRQGPKVPVNELVANRIARSLELPCPEGVIAEIDSKVIEEFNLEKHTGWQVSPGDHFATEQLANVYQNAPRNLIREVVNQDQFPGIILFDLFTLNSDRNNEGNFAITTGPGKKLRLHIIDHGHCFSGPQWGEELSSIVGSWKPSVFPEMVESISGMDTFQLFIQRILGLDDDFIANAVNNIPDQWVLSDSERGALMTFIRGQRNKVQSIIENNKNLFPNLK